MNLRDVKITIIMACHNSSTYLDEAINSVLTQTLRDLELILIDDCSTDHTIEIAQRHQAADDRISIISLPVHSGPAGARNAGIRVARGEWLGILDSDDVAMPSRFDEQVKFADCDKGLIMIGSNAISIDDKGRVIGEHRYPTGHRELVRRLYSLRAFPPHSSMIYRKDAVQRLSGFNPRFAPSEDADLRVRLSEVGKVGSIDKPLVKIRIHGQRVSNSEGGMLQVRLGLAALVSHFLRIHGCLDPSADDETAWREFVKWCNRRLLEEGVFERRIAWGDARAAFNVAEKSLAGTVRFTGRLLQSRHAGMLIWEKLFGSSLPKRLAKEWVELSCVTSQEASLDRAGKDRRRHSL
jgi:glycosyltransferase involved in cell wall biosynthesis